MRAPRTVPSGGVRGAAVSGKGRDDVPKSLLRIAATLAAGILASSCATDMTTVTFRYGLELEDRDGPRLVDEEFLFRSGDRFRFVMETESEAYAYLFNRGSGERSYAQLLPPATERAEALRTGEEVTVPRDGWYRMDAVAGTERMVLVLSTAPVDELELLDESALRADAFDERLADLERIHRPESSRRRNVDGRVELVAGGPEEVLLVVVRMPLQHEANR